MLRRAVLAFCVVLMTGCSPRTVSTASTPDYVPWLPLHTTGVYPQAPTPSPLAPVPIPAGTQPCKASQLEAASMDGGGATGHMNTPVGIRDRSSVACYLDGYPDITILDSAGRTLAQAAGVHDRGTFFDSWPPVRVLMTPGTPTLASEAHEPMSRGQAYLAIEWFVCKGGQAARLTMSLPDAGGSMTIPFNVRAPYAAQCDSYTPPTAGALRGPFSPAGYELPGPEYLTTDITISAPASVKRGTTLVYYVTVKNTSQSDYRLDPCPNYVEILGAKNPVAEYQLNCSPVGHVASGAGVKFEMKLSLPATVPLGTTMLQWALLDGRLAGTFVHATIAVD